MPTPPQDTENAIREAAYFIWEREGRPRGREREHWQQALKGLPGHSNADGERFEDEEKILDGRPDANLPAMLTRDVPGG